MGPPLFGMSTEANPRDRLLDAAEHLMHRSGYEAVGVAELCRVAGTKKGSFYFFFDSKQALAIEMLGRAWQRIRSTIFADSLENPTLGGLEGIERFGNLLADDLERMRDGGEFVVGCCFGNFAAELATRDETIRTVLTGILDDMIASSSVAIRRGVARGEIDASVEINDVATQVITHMEGLMLVAKTRRDAGLLRDLGPTMRRLLT